MKDEQITRINELYHKSKNGGLTPEELQEQQSLRQEYIASIKGAIAAQMENVSVQREDGSIEHVSERIKRIK